LHEQYADRPAADDGAGDQRPRIHHDDVERIAIAAEGVRDEAVISRIAHRGVEEAVDEQGSRGLVDFVLYRLAAERHLDDDVQVVWRIAADGDGVDVHCLIRLREYGARSRLSNATKARHSCDLVPADEGGNLAPPAVRAAVGGV